MYITYLKQNFPLKLAKKMVGKRAKQMLVRIMESPLVFAFFYVVSPSSEFKRVI